MLIKINTARSCNIDKYFEHKQLLSTHEYCDIDVDVLDKWGEIGQIMNGIVDHYDYEYAKVV